VDAAPSIPPLVAMPASLERLIDAVRVECPDLDLRAPLDLIEGFEKWIVVGDSWVARFPKSDAAAAAMGRERRLLNCLASHTTATIPRTLHAGGRVAFDVCTKVSGTPLWDDGHESWRRWPATRQARCAEDVGAFLAELQAALTSEDARALGCGPPAFPYPPSELAHRLSGQLADAESERFLARTLAEYEVLCVGPDDSALLHNDLIPHNCLVDPRTGALTGIVDFGDACIGDRHQDFQYLEGLFGPELVEAAIRRYEAIAGRALSRRRIALYHALAMLSHVAFAFEDPVARQLEMKLGWIRLLARDR
jgi:aminoglycoside phosphotransferase (APT) family kinase protein